ncbi:MAG: hypothetical protein ABIH35_02750 [Patescibacteria group bacterium]
MENRLVHFATPAEQQAENAEVSQAEQDPDSNLKGAAADIANIEKAGKSKKDIEKGGTQARAEAEAMIGGDRVTGFTKKLLDQRIKDIDVAGGAVKADRDAGRDDSKSAESLSSAVKALKKSVEFQKKQLSERATNVSEFGRFVSLSNAKELFQDVKVHAKSETKGSVDMTWEKFGSIEGFKQLDAGQQKELLKALREALVGDKGATKELRDKLLADKDVPDPWKDWLKKPESWKGPKEEQTLEYATKWINQNLGEMKMSAIKYEKFQSQNGQEFNKAGIVLWSLDSFRKKPRHERNDYLDKMESEARRLGLQAAEDIKSAQVSEGAQVAAKEKGLKNSGDQMKKAELEKFKNLQKNIEESPLRKRLLDRVKDAEKEATKDPSNIANPREETAKKGHVNVLKRVGSAIFARFGKQAENTEDVAEKNPDEKREHEEEHGRLVTGVVEEMTGGNEKEQTTLKNEDRVELDKIFNFKVAPEKQELQAALKIVALDTKKLTAENLKTEQNKQGNEWLKNKAQLQAADDSETR